MAEEVGANDDGAIYLDSDSDDEEDGHGRRPVADHLLSQESSTSLSPSQQRFPRHSNNAAIGFDSQAVSQAQDDEEWMDDGAKDEPDQGPGLGLGSSPSIDETPGDAEEVEQSSGPGNDVMAAVVAAASPGLLPISSSSMT